MSKKKFALFYYVTNHKGVREERRGVKMGSLCNDVARNIRSNVCNVALECIKGDENVKGIYDYLGFSIGQAIVDEVRGSHEY